MPYKKQRGQSRKLKRLKYYLDIDATEFPENYNQKMSHWHMPCGETFLNSPKTHAKIKTEAMQYLMEKAEQLYISKPVWAEGAKFFCMISYPDVWNSEILIFFDADNNELFHNFFNRETDEQRMTQINNRSFMKDRNLRVPLEFEEKGFLWEVFEESTGERTHKSELWMYGEF